MVFELCTTYKEKRKKPPNLIKEMIMRWLVFYMVADYYCRAASAKDVLRSWMQYRKADFAFVFSHLLELYGLGVPLETRVSASWDQINSPSVCCPFSNFFFAVQNREKKLHNCSIETLRESPIKFTTAFLIYLFNKIQLNHQEESTMKQLKIYIVETDSLFLKYNIPW